MLVEKRRCAWATNSAPDYQQYHDEEWGVPVHDDIRHFELLTLETAQAGLSWLTVLRKRAGYRAAFAGFKAEQIASFSEQQKEQLYSDARIVRHQQKIEATIHNAQRFIEIQDAYGSFDRYIWQFVAECPHVNHWQQQHEVPARTELSDRLSKDLRKKGFLWTGSTTLYAYLQAAGLVNDHLTSCFRHQELVCVA